MMASQRNWGAIPAEVLLQIFRFTILEVPDIHREYHLCNLCEIARVCKAWSALSQSILYSKVDIQDLFQFKRSFEVVSENPHLGRRVKAPTLRSDIFWKYEPGEIFEIYFDRLTHLLTTCLPNLEKLEGNVFSYAPVLHALHDSRLNNPKRISTPSCDLEKLKVANYATCILLMKDQVEKIVLIDDFRAGKSEKFTLERGATVERLYFNLLYDKLSQFNKLTELDVCKNTNEEIKIIEYIVANCKSLKTLKYEFSRPKQNINSTQNDSITIDKITSFIPSQTVKHLDATIPVSHNYNVLLYTTHKFPNLDVLSLTIDYNSTARFNQYILTQLLKYLSNIKTVSISGIRVDNHNISETIGNHWNSSSKPGDECLELIYLGSPIQRDEFKYGISKSNCKPGSTLTFQCHPLQPSPQHNDIFYNSGKYIGELRLEFSYEVRYELPNSLLEDAFKYCPNLRILYFEQCKFKSLDFSSIDFAKKRSIDELRLIYCEMPASFLDQLSSLLTEVKKLFIFDDCVIASTEKEELTEKAGLYVTMPHTKIGSLLIHNLQGAYQLKVFRASHQDYHYFRLSDSLVNSNQEDYAKVHENDRVYVNSLQLPKFYLGYYL